MHASLLISRHRERVGLHVPTPLAFKPAQVWTSIDGAGSSGGRPTVRMAVPHVKSCRGAEDKGSHRCHAQRPSLGQETRDR